jgi:hypothetical protein
MSFGETAGKYCENYRKHINTHRGQIVKILTDGTLTSTG